MNEEVRIRPLSQSEMRNELLMFKDGSELEINVQMRHDCPIAYISACVKAVRRYIVEENGDKGVAGDG